MGDEQLREAFEVFLATWFDEYDRAMLAPKELSSLKAAFEAGYAARDAEVQALRERNNQLMEALKDYVDADEMAVGEGYGTYPKSEHRRIRALVAGEEGSDND